MYNGIVLESSPDGAGLIACFMHHDDGKARQLFVGNYRYYQMFKRINVRVCNKSKVSQFLFV